MKNENCEIMQFDAIFICNGHYTVPYVPHFDGLDQFMGQKIHSHQYRCPEKFQNETVLVMGAGPSGNNEYLNEICFCILMIFMPFRKRYHV